MVSERKREANRQNAQKPRGPRKKSVGAPLAAPAFHPYQDFGTFHWDLDLLAALKASYQETLQPQNKLEENLVEMLCHATLRLKRVPYLEHEYHATHPKGFLFNDKENHFGPFYRAESKLFYQQLSRYETSAQRSFYKALDTLLKLQDNRLSCRGGACSARSTGQNFDPLDSKRSTPGTGGASPAPTRETMAIHHPSPLCHPGGSRDPVERTIQAPPPLPVQAFSEDPINWIPAPAGMTQRGRGEDLDQNPQQKRSQISHQTAPVKTLKTQALLANSPQENRWLTTKLATVSQKIKALTQTLLLSLRGALATWQSPPANTRSQAALPSGIQEFKTETTPSARNDKTSLHRSARRKNTRSAGLSSTGPDPPDTS